MFLFSKFFYYFIKQSLIAQKITVMNMRHVMQKPEYDVQPITALIRLCHCLIRVFEPKYPRIPIGQTTMHTVLDKDD